MNGLHLTMNTQLVLIDTWWNVNQDNSCRIFQNNFVLIDTWWNVNKLMLADVFPDA